MRMQIMAFTTVFFSLLTLASAQTKLRSPTKASPTAKKSPCQLRVEELIHASAQAMGLGERFGLHLNREVGETDITGRPLTNFSSGVFIVDDGYVSNSGATVVVRDPDKTCEILSLSVRVGG